MSGKKVFIRVFLIFCLAAALFGGCSREKDLSPLETKTNFNIVLIVSDAMRQDVLGCYSGEARTPHIDQLAKRGILFENAYSTSPWTPPSAVSIFTGNYATSYPCSAFEKTIKIQVPDEEFLLAEALRHRGYDTAIKSENVQASLHNCFQGFEVLSRSRFYTEFTDEAKLSIRQITNAEIRGHSPYLDSYHVLIHLLNLPEEKNFFIAQWILDPHEPYMPIKEFERRIVVDRADLSQPPIMYSARSNIDGELNEAEVRYLKARYMAEVESVDERVGYIQQMLEHKKLLESTYFIFTSDHGELFGEHGLFGHGINYFEELLRVPLIISGPGLPGGTRIKENVSLVDLMATLKDLLGIEYENNMRGESFRNLLFGDPAKTKLLYFDDVRDHIRVDALLDNDFKLVASRDGTCELYDLSNDPRERNNMADAYKDKVQAMLAEILAERKTNKQRQAANLLQIDGSEKQLNEEEKRELQKKLKSLGYIQ